MLGWAPSSSGKGFDQLVKTRLFNLFTFALVTYSFLFFMNQPYADSYSNRLYSNLTQAGAQCEFQQEVYSCTLTKEQSKYYPLKIKLFFTSSLIQDPDELILFFHGWFNDYAPDWITSLDRLHFFEVLQNSQHSNKLWIVPQSAQFDQTFINFFSNAKKTNTFITQIKSLLDLKSPALQLAGHSGAGLPISYLLRNTRLKLCPELETNLKTVSFFDATYRFKRSSVFPDIGSGNSHDDLDSPTDSFLPSDEWLPWLLDSTFSKTFNAVAVQGSSTAPLATNLQEAQTPASTLKNIQILTPPADEDELLSHYASFYRTASLLWK
jgi:hypothetical protein